MKPEHFDPAILLPDLGEAALRRILGDFFTASFNGIVITGVAAGYPILYANPAFCRMTGYTQAELAGQSPVMLQGPRTSRFVVQKMNDALRAGQPFHGAAINYRKDGEPYPVEWNISPVHDEQGQVRYFISVQKDLSDLRRVMSRLKRTNGHFRAFLRDMEQAREATELLPAIAAQKPQLTGDLLDDLRQCRPGEFFSPDPALVADDDLFDLGGSSAPDDVALTPQECISAADYGQAAHFSATDIAELQIAISETRQQLDLMELSDDKSAELLIIADNLQELANSIFYLDDFIALSTVLAELATRTRDSARQAVPPFVADIYRALLQDVETWVDTVFVSRTARDIHELDNSIISSARQLLMFLPTAA